MLQFRGIIFTLFGLCSMSMAAETCATQEKIEATNGLVSDVFNLFTPILSNTSLTPSEINTIILDQVCNNATVQSVIGQIETSIGGCPDLILVSSVATLTLGPLTFMSLFENFENVDNFCSCTPPLMSAMALNDTSVQTMLMGSTGNGAYSFINVASLCGSDIVMMAVKNVAESRTTCPKLYKYADILDEDNVVLMNNFRADQCPIFDNTKFNCAVEASASQIFKNCITEAEKKPENERPCGRRACAMSMATNCGVGRAWYMHAVNMKISTAEPFELQASNCYTNDASFVVASFSLIVALIMALYILDPMQPL